MFHRQLVSSVQSAWTALVPRMSCTMGHRGVQKNLPIAHMSCFLVLLAVWHVTKSHWEVVAGNVKQQMLCVWFPSQRDTFMTFYI